MKVLQLKLHNCLSNDGVCPHLVGVLGDNAVYCRHPNRKGRRFLSSLDELFENCPLPDAKGDEE